MKKLLSAVLICAMLTCAVPSVLVNSVSAVSLTLKESSHLVLDSSTGYIDKIDGTITADELKREFETPIWITGGDGSAKEGDTPVASDDTVTLESGSENIKVLIYGDLNRDGLIDMSDVIALMKQLAGWDEDICSEAANIDAENQDIDTDDAVKLLKYIAGWEVSPGNVRMTAANEKLTAANEDSDIELYFTSTMNKIGRSNTNSTGQYTYKMTLAGNETESCQVFISSKANKEGLSLELSEFEYEFGGATLTGSLNWEYYYRLSLFNQVKPVDYDNYVEDYFPEALPPMADTFELTADRSQGIMISVTTEKNAPAGMYRATLDIKNSDGQVIKTAYVYAYVYDFSLPDTPYSTSAFNIDKGDLFSKRKEVWEDKEAATALYTEYYEFLLDNNLSAYTMPYRVIDPEADQYMDDPRVTSFVIAGMKDKYGGTMYLEDNEVVAAYNKVKDNETWFNKGYFYYTDEAYGKGLITVKNAYDHLVSLLGTTNFRNMTPQADNHHPLEESLENWVDPVEYIKDYINVWCPQSHAYHDWATGGKWSLGRSVAKYGEYSERAKAFRERGDSIWWYVCVSPEMPYANFFNYYQGVCARVLLWQQFMNNVDGLLYFATTNAWSSISKYNYSPISGGDGLLLYWGELYGFEGPVASWRLLQIRDGFDDYDYLRIAEGLYGREAVMEVVNSVTTDMLEYSEDYHDIESAKEVLARMIEDAT